MRDERDIAMLVGFVAALLLTLVYSKYLSTHLEIADRKYVIVGVMTNKVGDQEVSIPVYKEIK